MIDTINLAKEGFSIIRNALKRGGNSDLELAKGVAEALHNLPEKDNQFLVGLLIESVNSLVAKYPQCKSLHYHIPKKMTLG